MNTPPSRISALGIVTLALGVTASAGVASATTEPLDPASSAPPGGVSGCVEIVAVLGAQDAFVGAYLDEDGTQAVAILAALPALGDAAVAAAPAEIADTVATAVEPFAVLPDVLGGVEATDVESLSEVFASVPPAPDSDAAFEELIAWATENCGYEAFDPFADAPEPQGCELLDAAAAAAAAGLDIDVTDSDGHGDFNLPGFWTKSCSYGNGAMALSTISFNSLDQATQFYLDNLSGGGELLDVDLGSLPASTLVTEQGGMIAVSVLEATVPFSVGFSADEVTPEAAIAAAEAVFVSLPSEVPPPPMSSDAP